MAQPSLSYTLPKQSHDRPRPFTPLHVCSPSMVALHLQTDLKDTAHVAAFLTEQTAAVATDLQRQSQVGGFIGTFCRK